MTKLFYDHLIIIEDIELLFTQQKISSEDQQKLLALIHKQLEHTILDTILTYLPEAHHKEFLHKLVHHPYDQQIMTYLKERITVDIEFQIMKTAEKTKRQIIRQIKKTTRTST